MKNFSEMTDAEFNNLKKKAALGEPKMPKFSGKILEDIIYSEFKDWEIQKRNQSDAVRWLRDRNLSNAELKQKIKLQLVEERKERDEIVIDWNFLLSTTLFNSPKI